MGIVTRLPLRYEFELARLLHGSVQLLELRTAPWLIDGEGGSKLGVFQQHGFLGVCTASLMLHAFCDHWVGYPEVQRLIATSADTWTDQPLPTGLSRRPPPDIRPLLRELAVASSNNGALLALLVRRVPPDIVQALRGVAQTRAGARRRGYKRAASQGTGQGSSQGISRDPEEADGCKPKGVQRQEILSSQEMAGCDVFGGA